MLRKVIYLVLFSLTQVCYGQLSSTALHFDHLTIGDGLSHNTAYCILQDQYGYIWIGTQNGLNKYDGYSFEVYRSSGLENGQENFIGKHISSLFEDKHGNLWVGTKKQGINFKAKFSDQFINLQSDSAFVSIKGIEISSFFEDNAGYIWITTIGAGVLKYKPDTKEAQIFNQKNNNLSSDVTFDILEDKFGTIWVAAAGGGINYLANNDQFELSHQMLPNHPNMGGYRKILFLDDDHLWVGTEGTGLYKMNLNDRTYEHFAPENEERTISSYVVRDIYKTKDGRIFIATDGAGLNVYDPATEEIAIYTVQAGGENALNSDALFSLMEDRTGNLWIGTFNGGINIYKPQKTYFDFFVHTKAQSNEIQSHSVLSILQRSNGDLLVGTDGGGMSWLNQSKDHSASASFTKNTSSPYAIAGNVVKTIFEDSKNRLWIGLFGEGLDLFNPDTKSFQHIIDDQTSVWSIAERKDGKILIATLGNGIKLLDPITQEVSDFLNYPMTASVITIIVDQDGRLWIGTNDSGLKIWSVTSNRLISYQHNPLDSFSISNDGIRSIFQDSKGEIWIGTEGGGINRWLGNGRFERINIDDGLISNSVMGITEDKSGSLWVTTYEGISRIDKENNRIQNFDFRTTEYINQFNQGAILSSENGMLFFGGTYGLHTILPENVKQNRQQGDILFTDVRIYNKSVPVGKLETGRVILEQAIEVSSDIWLSYLDQSFSIDFTAIDYTNPWANEFAYQMEGFNDDWQYTSNGQRSVTYTNLDPDTYIFRVKHKQKEASIKVHIMPPYWETLWFKTLISLLTLAVLFSGLFFWIKRREAAHKRKILQLQNEKLASEVEVKNSKLMFSSAQMAHKNEILTELKKNLIEFEKQPESSFRTLVRKLDHELKNEDYWKEFNLYFNEVDQNFLDILLNKHPDLTKNDLRLCSLLRMNLSTKEIASLLNVTIRGVEQSRYRLKKRLGLGKDGDLDKYITMFNQELS